ncbi:yeats family-domain-containing protein [Syncephalis plumigaleata]|nr:yeats family-domain-containing protein [Syncephalis plumigaleata]
MERINLIIDIVNIRETTIGKENFSHRWMVYITGPSQDPNEISTYLERVRFYIHPSYRPHDIIDVVKPPFQLLRYGWGEFPVRLQLFFSDTRNKPVDIVHMLRLDDSHSGEQTQGAERTFDIELDRNTRFNLDRSSTTVEKEETMDTDKQTSTIEETPVSVKKEMPDMNMNSSDTQVPINSNDNQSISSDKKSSNDQLDSLLHQAYQQYPLVGNKDTKQNSQNGTRRISYRLASSIDEFTNWTHGRQKSVQHIEYSGNKHELFELI